MGKRSDAPAAPRRRRRRRPACIIPFLNGNPLRFLPLLGATARKPARRRRRLLSSESTCEIARPEEQEPKRAEAGEEPHEKVVEARAADVAAAAAGKYWAHRHSLFSLYDRGVRMDAESWYSATPEAVAASQAAHAAPHHHVVDAFAGCGGNSIQFAARGCYVIAVEIDPHKVEMAAHNARVYGVEDRIEFIIGDFFRLAPCLKADVVFLSPPWGGPSYIQAPVYTLDMLKPKDGYTTFQAAQRISPNIIMFLPRTVDIGQVEELSWLSCPPLGFESEENFVHHRCKGITAYFGETARSPSASSKLGSRTIY